MSTISTSALAIKSSGSRKSAAFGSGCGRRQTRLGCIGNGHDIHMCKRLPCRQMTLFRD
jgi:hypothetical protein